MAIFADGNGTAVEANGNSNQSSHGVFAKSTHSFGVFATTDDGAAVQASSNNGTGLAVSSNGGTAVSATSKILGSQGGTAIFAQSGTGNAPHPPPGIGVHAVGAGASPTNRVFQARLVAEGGSGNAGNGVVALTTNGTAVSANDGGKGNGVLAGTNGGVAVKATDNGSGVAVNAISDGGTGVVGTIGTGIGVLADGGTAGVALKVLGKVQVQGNSVGSVTMAAGTKTLTVHNAAATPNSLIFLTPFEDPKAFLWIGARNAGNFTIDASTALPTNVTIMFLIIN